MALFGFSRESGTSRGYVNAHGVRLSRRQYDKLAAASGAGRPSKGSGKALEAARAFAEQKVRDLASRSRVPKRRLAQAIRQRERVRVAHAAHHQAQGGQRAYNVALDMYVRRERGSGSRITKQRAKSSPEFKEIMRGLKPEKPRRRENPDARRRRQERNARRREDTFKLLGDRHGEEFRELYQEQTVSVLIDEPDEGYDDDDVC